MLRYVLFDLDNTLYPPSSGLWEQIGHRINLYMMERVGIPAEEVSATRVEYLNAFGTTLNALRHYYRVDPDDFLEFVHDLPLSRYLERDPELDAMLARMELGKVVFTNSDRPHAERVLAQLGIGGHFEKIIDIRALAFVNKPEQGAYERVLQIIPAQPSECVFVEDSLVNLLPARKMGMTTVLVREGAPAAGADYQIARITDLDRVPGLIGAAGK